jgi:hypothetical protein
MGRNFILLLSLSLVCIPKILSAQSSFLIGGGYEVNSIKRIPKSLGHGEFVIPADFPLSAWTVNLLLRKNITKVSALHLMVIYSQHRYPGFYRGNINPSLNELGFRRVSLRPAYAYGKGPWQASIGGDVGILFQHFHGYKGIKRNALSGARPERFNMQFGLSASFGYDWKRFMLQANTSIGLFYREPYVEYLETFNTFGVTVFYRVVGGD